MARAPSTLSLVFGTVILGILAGALLVKQTVKPIDTSRLVPVRDAQLGKAVGSGSVPQGRVMVASRRAVREIYAPVTFSGVVKRLFSKTPPPYNFREEVYESVQAKLSKKATLDESGAGSDAESEDPPEGDAGSEEPSEGWDEDWDIQEVHLWSDTPPGHDEEGDVELQDILTYNLAGFVFFMAVLLYMEVSACLRRRQRDFLLATAAWRGNDTAFKAQCAKESQIMLYRPFVSWGAAIGIWSVVKSGMDVYGKCFFNWDCFFNFDCHLRILIPAEFECTFDVMLPAAVVTGVMICGVLAAVWVFTRPWASLVLLGTFVTGVFAIWTVSLFACTLWLFCAVGFNYFYFAMLLYKHEAPAWCEDLGSLSFASNPRSGAIRDGDKAQHWHENPDGTKHPSRSELSQLLWFERVCYHIADFYHTHLRGLRVLWNGAVMRAVVLLIIGRRVRVFGEENVQHLGSHDKVLVASNHRTFFDFWIITVCGLWAKTGATLFSFYPVRSTWFYTHVAGLLMNMTFSSFAMFPPIMNTPSDKNKEENMRSKESAHKWNDYALRRVIADLKCPGVLCGIHPEGTRNHSTDPYDILPTKPGVGRVALESPDAHVVPVFVIGMQGDVWEIIQLNYAHNPLDKPVDIVFGPPVDLSDLRQRLKDGTDAPESLWAEAGDRVTEAIKQLAESHPQHVMRRVNQERKQAKEIETQRYQTDNEIQVESGAV